MKLAELERRYRDYLQKMADTAAPAFKQQAQIDASRGVDPPTRLRLIHFAQWLRNPNHYCNGYERLMFRALARRLGIPLTSEQKARL